MATMDSIRHKEQQVLVLSVLQEVRLYTLTTFSQLASASSPLAAGIAALVLEANPNLTWLDFQYVLKMSTIKTGMSQLSGKLTGFRP
jgi:hypothetical protein